MHSRKWLLVVAGTGIAIVVVLVSFAGYYGDWLWFQNLGFGQVFLTELWAKAVVSCGAFILFALFAGVNLWYARRLGRPTRAIRVVDQERPVTALELVFRGDHAPHAWVAAILLLSAFMGLTATSSWMTFLQFLHGSRFGVADPIFGKDAGFYLFSLPFYSLVLQLSLFSLFITFVVVALSYYLDGAVGAFGDRSIVGPRVKSHMAVLAGLFFVGLAVSNRLKLFKLL
jgi:uncharacterized membrane protein (UPF0182 family)